MLDKEAGAAAGAAAVHAKKNLTGIRSNNDFFKKSSPRMGPATAACKTQKVKSFL
jgi:hypothetical protein